MDALPQLIADLLDLPGMHPDTAALIRMAVTAQQTGALPDLGPLAPVKNLFIPLKREHFTAFVSGGKTEEFRPLGPRWNATTCAPGRRALLSLGYGKRFRRLGTVTGFRVVDHPETLPGYAACYPGRQGPAAAIKITLDPIP